MGLAAEILYLRDQRRERVIRASTRAPFRACVAPRIISVLEIRFLQMCVSPYKHDARVSVVCEWIPWVSMWYVWYYMSYFHTISYIHEYSWKYHCYSEKMAKACNSKQPDGLPVAVSLWAVARHCLLHVDISAELEVVGDDLLVWMLGIVQGVQLQQRDKSKW